MGFIKEFKEFAIKGNAFDLAVGVIVGAAFGKIVTSIIDDLIMPIVAAIVSKPDFSSVYFAIGKGSELIPKGSSLAKAKVIAPDAAIFAYGNFITIAINFLLLAFIVFLMVKSINKLKNKQAEDPKIVASSTDTLLSEIRDELRKKTKQTH
ncbi:large conductance mechanosensitive channel protein MscL [Elizabethkingia anophelis]|uniref:large conductance mechanosensitive channel protein MscL n=1 Tax=Elizabethkingia anophelis TaxID=1117645 RepID=UPI00084021CB|nr:large conductance mechanosensitive channel protein MscL [Elizabethkingia anophelis]MCT3801060.1 large conductance mechanosensitive channel protein MscL [Elizabethkingia anophelis]MCT4057816.1 large conductance mechanosensitive channel protein MscL [Elizabethkingia anophelis]MCT4068224.1 large conductance mechanosensitive channel protein MscL [Elizabethkingia anophelis]MCT4118961.1 large conductance mechanosensitive channel protein MscL [Elizabethkingia anophelis]MCT4140042.1 large conductan